MRRTLTITASARTARAAPAVVLVAALVGVLGGCSGGGGGLYGGGGSSPSTDSGTTSDGTTGDGTGSGPALGTADSSLGTIVVDGQGMTVYYYDKDTKGSGTSACEGECAAAWPAVHAASAEPEVEGVTAEVGTITGVDGELQVTVDGRPVYTYAADQAEGDVSGQGVNGVWHVVAPDGTEIMDAAPAAGSGY
ncbi:COG4315 family predicted lipoprotein [Cellulosimicrobium sp. 22601]|uniref:COG4315 family predicted lipoprotein n=1 Tax=unclassified Cellulosimicrobium TaxID=2624466 RepID=UPI003F8703EF